MTGKKVCSIFLIPVVVMTVFLMTDCEKVVTAVSPEAEEETRRDIPDFSGRELVVSTWEWSAGALEEISRDFEDSTGCTVVIDPAPGDEERLDRLRAQRAEPQIDVALFLDFYSAVGNEEGLFRKIDPGVVSNMEHLHESVRNRDGYGTAFSLSRYGIVYVVSRVPEPSSYRNLVEDEIYQGQFILPRSDSVPGVMLLRTMTESTPEPSSAVASLLDNPGNDNGEKTQWYSSPGEVVEAFRTETAAAAVFPDTLVPRLQQAGMNIRWIEPEEGILPAVRTANIVKGCRNPEPADYYINYLLSDDVQSRIHQLTSDAPVSQNISPGVEDGRYFALGESEFAALTLFDHSRGDNNLHEVIVQ